MFSSYELNSCRAVDFSSYDTFTDLRDIQIDDSKKVEEKVESFLEQVKNPYLFKVGDVFVRVNYKGKTNLSDSIIKLLKNT